MGVQSIDVDRVPGPAGRPDAARQAVRRRPGRCAPGSRPCSREGITPAARPGGRRVRRGAADAQDPDLHLGADRVFLGTLVLYLCQAAAASGARRRDITVSDAVGLQPRPSPSATGRGPTRSPTRRTASPSSSAGPSSVSFGAFVGLGLAVILVLVGAWPFLWPAVSVRLAVALTVTVNRGDSGSVSCIPAPVIWPLRAGNGSNVGQAGLGSTQRAGVSRRLAGRLRPAGRRWRGRPGARWRRGRGPR